MTVKAGNLISGDGWQIIDVQRWERPQMVESLAPDELVKNPGAYRAVPDELWSQYTAACREVERLVREIKAAPNVGLQATPGRSAP